jgi:pimeloyl-ACP methyl ester carboxylesterase
MLANVVVREDGTIAPRLRRDRHLAILRDLWEQRPGDRFPKVDVPVVLLPAGGPRHVSAALEVARTSLADGRVHPFPGADHDVHAQRPAEVAAVLAEAWR